MKNFVTRSLHVVEVEEVEEVEVGGKKGGGRLFLN